MSDALFLAPFGQVSVGGVVRVTGEEAHHAVTVRRIRVGEQVLVADGEGRAVRGPVLSTSRDALEVEVSELLAPELPELRFVVVQALPKGERAEIAVQAMTEAGVWQVVAWQASRSVVRWQGERAAKSLAKWQGYAREATKQARRFRVPQVSAAATADVVDLIAEADAALVLHEVATTHIAHATLPERGTVVVIVGPEGGISPEELDAFTAAGASPWLISDGVLRTSTAGVVALAQLDVLRRLA